MGQPPGSTSMIPQAPAPEQGICSARERCLSLPDILRCIGEQIVSKRVLSALCLTSRQFYVEFSYFLYREVDIVGNWMSSDQSNPLNGGWSASRSPNLRHVRKATVQMPWPGNPWVVNEHLCQILERMPELRILQWDDCPIDFRTLIVLKVRCPKLKGLSINTYRHLESTEIQSLDPIDAGKIFLAMAKLLDGCLRDLNIKALPFATKLRYLSYFSTSGNRSVQTRALAYVLRSSPELEHLGLSVEPHSIRGSRSFARLCDEFGTIGGAPLKLKSLYLGRDVLVPTESGLAKLTGVSYLESLTIVNATTRGPADSLSNAADTFDPIKCPRLRHLWFERHSQAMMEFCRKLVGPDSNGQPPSRLVDCFTMYPYAHFADTVRPLIQAQVGSTVQPVDVSLPFRMLSITLAVEDPAPADLSTSDNDDDKDPHCWQVEAAIESLNVLINTTKHTLEGLVMDVPTRIRKRGGMAVQADISRAIHILLPRLTVLKALAIRLFAHDDDRMWENPREEQLLGLARYYAGLVPGLRYIAVTDNSWRINRTPTGVVLEEMVEKEVECVELFYRSWPASLIDRWSQAQDENMDPHPFPYMANDSHLK